MNFPWNQSLTDILWLPVAQKLMMLQSLLVAQSYCEVFGILLTQFFTLGAASSFIRWKYCVIVHVSIIVVQLPHKHCGAINWSLLRACRCSEIVSGTFTHAEKRRNHNRRGNWQFFWSKVVWVMTFTNSVSCVHLSPVNEPLVSVSVNCCVVLTYLIWIIGSKLMPSCSQYPNRPNVCVMCDALQDVSLCFYHFFVILEDVRMLNYRAFGCT